MTSRTSSAASLSRQPAVVAYKTVEDLVLLKEWFYNFDATKDNRRRAVQKVQALNSRGRLPHAIETTAWLTSTCLMDPALCPDSSSAQRDANVLRLSYSMALTRFVNGYLDPLQQSNFAIALHQLAKAANIPSFFVELRHMATHESLPTLDMLRIAAKDALNWLYDNYWARIEDADSDIEEQQAELTEDRERIAEAVEATKKTIDAFMLNLKVYKKIRKQDLNTIYKYGNSTPTGQKYWKALKSIKQHTERAASNELTLIKTLLYKNFLIYPQSKLKENDNGTKYTPLLTKLYGPLLHELGPEFKLRIVLEILKSEPDAIDQAIDKELGFQWDSDTEKEQAVQWAAALLIELAASRAKISLDSVELRDQDSMVNFILPFFSNLEPQNRSTLIKSLLPEVPKIGPETQNQLNVALAHTRNQIIQEFDTIPPIDDEQEQQPPPKKAKTASPPQAFFFAPHESWKPMPFGTIV